jgi:hypothetical protein
LLPTLKMAKGLLTDGVRLAMLPQLRSTAPRVIRRRHSRLLSKIPGFDAAKVALFLLAPHPKMPDMELSRTEAGDLAAYIATLN